MKRRYSPAVRARIAHERAKYGKPAVVQEVQQTDPIAKLVESYQQGFITAVELADLILQALPEPEAERVTATVEAAHQRALREHPEPAPSAVADPERCRNCGGRPVFKDGLCKDCYFEWHRPTDSYHGPERPQEWTPGTAEDWARSLTPPSPPWEAPANQPPAGVAQWEWELGKTDAAQHICGYCGAPYYPGDSVYCALCAPREGGTA